MRGDQGLLTVEHLGTNKYYIYIYMSPLSLAVVSECLSFDMGQAFWFTAR